jgi:hypothetical protein
MNPRREYERRIFNDKIKRITEKIALLERCIFLSKFLSQNNVEIIPIKQKRI